MNEIAKPTRTQRRDELAEMKFAKGHQGGALMQPANGRELMDMANMMSQSGQMVRDFYRGNAGDCAALIMMCQPYGFNPFMVSWKTYKASKNADAPIAFEGQLVNAMVNQSAPVRGRLKYDYSGEGTARQCKVTGIDRETGEEITYTSPKISEITVKNSPLWKADPDQQLGYFSARSWARRHFPELLLGVYTVDEVETIPHRGPNKAKDVTPGGFAEMAAQARTPEAEILGPEDQSPTIEAEDVSQDEAEEMTAFPGAKEYTEGQEARVNGIGVEECPYADGQERADWLGGFESAA